MWDLTGACHFDLNWTSYVLLFLVFTSEAQKRIFSLKLNVKIFMVQDLIFMSASAGEGKIF